MIDTRPTWDIYFLGIAKAVAERADCTRRQASAVIVKNHRIVSTGYNGAPSGDPGCMSAGACPRGQLTPDELKAYTDYEAGPGRCIAVHAEANALLYASRSDVEGAVMYMYSSVGNGAPCSACSKLCRGSGLDYLVWSIDGVTAQDHLAVSERARMGWLL